MLIGSYDEASNTFVEERAGAGGKRATGNRKTGIDGQKSEPAKLSQVSMSKEDRIRTKIGERGQGIGRRDCSRFLNFGRRGSGHRKVYAFAASMPEAGKRGLSGAIYIRRGIIKQIKIRAERIGEFGDNLLLLCETNLDMIKETIYQIRPQAVVIDSIQTMYSEEVSAAPGSVSQVREATGVFCRLPRG